LQKELKELGKVEIPSRSSYFGILDLAGFKKDRFYLYQSHWRPDFPMAHIFPHWNWPERIGQVTPVSGDEAELFLNGKSLGRKKKGQYEYRLRWDDVTYQPGELKVVATRTARSGRRMLSRPPVRRPRSRSSPTAQAFAPTAWICPTLPSPSPTKTALSCRAPGTM
jgi:hypothetical protein